MSDETTRSVVEGHQYFVVEAESAEEAVRKARKHDGLEFIYEELAVQDLDSYNAEDLGPVSQESIDVWLAKNE